MINHKFGTLFGQRELVSILLEHPKFDKFNIFKPLISIFLIFIFNNFGIPDSRTKTAFIRSLLNCKSKDNFTFDKLVETKSSFFLELGSSFGKWAFVLEDSKNCNGICVDIDKEDGKLFNKIAKKLDSKLKFINADILKIDFGKNRFDLVYGIEFIDHVKDDLKLLKKIHKWLKPEGILIFQVPFHFKESAVVPAIKTGHKHDFFRNGYCEETFESINRGFFDFQYYRIEKRNQWHDPCRVCNNNRKQDHPLKLVGIGRKK